MVRPKHSAWYGFTKVKVEEKARPQAKCNFCDKVLSGTDQKRLLAHSNCCPAKKSAQASVVNSKPDSSQDIEFEETIEIEDCSLNSVADPEYVPNFSNDSTEVSQNIAESTSNKRKNEGNHEVRSKVFKGSRGNPINKFLDSIDENMSDELDMLLGKFLIENDIPFDVVNSVHIQQFMKKIRPSYRLPSSVDFESKILNNITAQCMKKVHERSNQELCLLLVHDLESNKIITWIKTTSEKAIFFGELPIVGKIKTELEFQEIMKNLMTQARSKFNGSVVSVFANCLEFDLEENHSFFVTKCQESTIKEISEDASSSQLLEKVENILNAFNLVFEYDLEAWKNEYEKYKYFSDNIKNIRAKAAVQDNLINSVLSSLYDSDLLKEVNKKLEILQILFEISVTDESLGEKISLLQDISALIPEDSNLSKKIFTKVNLLALVLNHKFKDKLLNSNQKFSSRYFLAKLLNDPGEFVKFEQFLKSKNEFQDEELNNMDTKTFWTIVEGSCPKLAKIALTLADIPGSLNNVQPKHAAKVQNEELSKKLSVLKSII